MSRPPSKRQGVPNARTNRKSEPDASAKQTKKQIAISKKQARQNRIIWLSVAGVVLLVVLVLAFGLAQELVFKPQAPVARVNGVAIRGTEFQELLKYRRYSTHMQIQSLQQQLDQIDPNDQTNQFLLSFYQSQLEQLQASLLGAADNTVDELIDDALVREKAGQAGLTVTDEEVATTIDEDVRRAASPAPQTPITDTETIATATPIPQERLDEVYQNALDSMGLSDRGFRTIVKRGLYRDKVQELLASQVVTTGLVIHVHLVEAGSQDGANAALARVQAGEDFAIVARDVSTDTLATEQGGDLGWITTGQLARRFGQEVEDAAFALEPGNSQSIPSGDTYYVISVSERDENGPLPAEVLTERQNSALADWLTERKASPDVSIERLLKPDQIPPDPLATPSGVGSLPSSGQ